VRSNFTEDDCRRGAKENIWNEKDEDDEAVAIADELESFCHTRKDIVS
jgi:hypothetical protein